MIISLWFYKILEINENLLIYIMLLTTYIGLLGFKRILYGWVLKYVMEIIMNVNEIKDDF